MLKQLFFLRIFQLIDTRIQMQMPDLKYKFVLIKEYPNFKLPALELLKNTQTE